MPNIGPIHTLIVRKLGTEHTEFEDCQIEHPVECNVAIEGEGEMTYQYYDCAVDWNVNAAGLKFCLEYSDTPIAEPGTYRIQAWSETYHGFDYTEHDGGISVVTDEGEQNEPQR
jgi:hypothetical protein